MARDSRLFVKLIAGLVLLFAAAVGHADDPNPKPDDQKDLDRLAGRGSGRATLVRG